MIDNLDARHPSVAQVARHLLPNPNLPDHLKHISEHTGRDPRAKHIEATGDGVEVAERMAREGKL